jgi:hypothetical protein
MKKGFTIGFNAGSKASHFLVPTAAAVAAAYGGHELAEYLMETNAAQSPENIKNIVEYGSAGVGALVGAGGGWLSRYTYVPQVACGTVGGVIGATLELGLYAVAIPTIGAIEGVKKLQKWRKSKQQKTIDDRV